MTINSQEGILKIDETIKNNEIVEEIPFQFDDEHAIL
jgi:hypothetical protein